MIKRNENGMDRPKRTYPTIGACGLDCGLCTRYYTVGPSRCPGCCGADFFDKHPSCSFITCCVKKSGFETCGECPEFPCSKFKSEEEYQARDLPGYPPDRNIFPNLNFIKEHGIRRFVQQHRKRIRFLEKMLENFDDGRSRSFFCRAAALLDSADLRSSLDKASRRIRANRMEPADRKGKAKLLRGLLNEVAEKQGIELKVKKSAEKR